MSAHNREKVNERHCEEWNAVGLFESMRKRVWWAVMKTVRTSILWGKPHLDFCFLTYLHKTLNFSEPKWETRGGNFFKDLVWKLIKTENIFHSVLWKTTRRLCSQSQRVRCVIMCFNMFYIGAVSTFNAALALNKELCNFYLYVHIWHLTNCWASGVR